MSLPATINILVLEDDAAHGEALRREFRKADPRYAVTVTATIKEYSCEMSRSLPDLVITDARLPDGDVFDVFAGLDEARDFPVLVMTSFGDEAMAVRVMKAGATDYIPKSENTFRDMPRLAEKALHEWEQLRERERLKRNLQESREKFRSYVDNAPDGIFVVDETGRYLEVNRAACDITGYSAEEILAMSIPDLLTPDSLEAAADRFASLIATGSVKAEFQFRHKNGSCRWWSVDAVKLSDTRFLGFAKDITERKTIESAHQFLLQCVYRSPEENFFESLARFLGETLGVYYVCIDRLSGDRLSAQTVAVYCDGKFEDNLEYALEDTPCGVLASQTVCLFPRDVCSLFPNDPALQEIGGESYVGITLWDHEGNPIGLIALIDRKPMEDAQLAESILRMVSTRASGELERLKGMEALRRNAETQVVLREIAQATVLASSPEELYHAVHHQVMRILPAKNFFIAFLDEMENRIVVPYNIDEYNVVPRCRPVEKGLTEYVMRLKQPVYVNEEILARLRADGEVSSSFTKLRENYLGAPLITQQDSAFGVIGLNWTDDLGLFRSEYYEVISIIASQISLAIERRQKEESLAESEARYRALLEQAPEAILVIEPDTGEILEANSRFTDRFGYDLKRDGPLRVQDITEDKPGNVEALLVAAKTADQLPLQRRVVRHRKGFFVQVERSGTFVRYQNRRLLTVNLRDVSEEVRREQEISNDAQLATKVQNALLSSPAASEQLEIDIIYRPHSYVGGDLYFMDWRYGGKVLRGCLIDTAGHGLSTALHTSAMHVLIREVNEMDLPLSEQMRWLNQRAHEYFDEGTFAGALAFELDLQTRTLRWATAGITDIWVSTRQFGGIVKRSGMFLGMRMNENFETHSLPLGVGDSLYFLTDGLADLIEKEKTPVPIGQFAPMVQLLRSLAESPNRRDDATAICIRIRSFLEGKEQSDDWPRIFHFDGYGDYLRLRDQLCGILAELTGLPHSVQEIAVSEALANALDFRSGKARHCQARLRLIKAGNRLIARVKSSRSGFAGNATLQRLRAHPEEMFSFGEDSTMGRGIPIMLSLSHWMAYNSEGTEVLLAWKLPVPKP